MQQNKDKTQTCVKMQKPGPKGRNRLNSIQGPESPCSLRKAMSTSGCLVHRGSDALVPDCYKTFHVRVSSPHCEARVRFAVFDVRAELSPLQVLPQHICMSHTTGEKGLRCCAASEARAMRGASLHLHGKAVCEYRSVRGTQEHRIGAKLSLRSRAGSLPQATTPIISLLCIPFRHFVYARWGSSLPVRG
jgi:hypothetical protein